MRLAVTGGTGFVGQKLIASAIARGHQVAALTRRGQDETPGVTWISGDLANRDALTALCNEAEAIIHIAGVINAADREGFFKGNVEGTEALLAAAADVPRLVHVSSLTARAPEISVYGESKAAADARVQQRKKDWVIVRPPAVYGPGDAETANLYKLVARGFAFLPGPGRFSVVHVGDLVNALLALAETGAGRGRIFEIDDGRAGGVSHREMAEFIAGALGVTPRYIRVLPAALRLGAAFDTFAAWLKGTRPALSFDRARYFAYPDWTADSAPLRALGVWAPEIGTRDGIARTAAWYRAEGWI